MKSHKKKLTEIKCNKCGHINVFNQPYPYHAGFGNQGFLYNEAGNKTLIWSSFDSDYQNIIKDTHPWALNSKQQKLIENKLKKDIGGKWLFKNPARCLKCSNPISKPMLKDIYYLEYDGSLNLDNNSKEFKEVLKTK